MDQHAFSQETDDATIAVTPIVKVLNAETVDADSNGQIDHIRITTDANLDDDFTGLSAAVSGYFVDGTTPFVTSLGAGGINDDVFYIRIDESGFADTGVTPTTVVTSNTTLSEVSGSGDLVPSVMVCFRCCGASSADGLVTTGWSHAAILGVRRRTAAYV